MLDSLFKFYNEMTSTLGLSGISASFTAKDIIQIFIVVIILLYIHHRFIRNTQSEKLIRGILFFIFGAWLFSGILIALEFEILGQIAQYILAGLLLSMVIVFQPELRKLLLHLGQTKFDAKNISISETIIKKKKQIL